jgi:hypothetical protein
MTAMTTRCQHRSRGVYWPYVPMHLTDPALRGWDRLGMAGLCERMRTDTEREVLVAHRNGGTHIWNPQRLQNPFLNHKHGTSAVGLDRSTAGRVVWASRLLLTAHPFPPRERVGAIPTRSPRSLPDLPEPPARAHPSRCVPVAGRGASEASVAVKSDAKSISGVES